MINLIYEDGQNANVQVQATDHTNPKLAFDPAGASACIDARVYLAGDEQLFGKLEAMEPESLTLTTTWGDRIDVPLARVTGVYMGMADHKETPESFAKRFKSPASEDLLLARAKDGEVVASVESSRRRRTTSSRSVTRARAVRSRSSRSRAWFWRHGPRRSRPTEVRPTFTLSGGLVLSGRWSRSRGTSGRWRHPGARR